MTSPTLTNQQNILFLFSFHLNMFQIRTIDPVVERDYSVVYFCAKYVHRELHPPQTFIISSNPIQTKRILSKPNTENFIQPRRVRFQSLGRAAKTWSPTGGWKRSTPSFRITIGKTWKVREYPVENKDVWGRGYTLMCEINCVKLCFVAWSYEKLFC